MRVPLGPLTDQLLVAMTLGQWPKNRDILAIFETIHCKIRYFFYAGEYILSRVGKNNAII